MSDDPRRGSGKFASILAGVPKEKNVRGERYVPAVFQIMSKDEFGRPKNCTMVHEEESVHLDGGEEFMVGFVKDVFAKPVSKGKA